ncbi:MAG: 3-oxoacyl-ACP synthase [Cyclobacteriaceae bacterium]
MTDFIKLKEKLLGACEDYANDRIDAIQGAILSAKQGAFEENKSSAGDKYETGRAMMHLEIENQTAQLSEAQRLAREVKQIKLKSYDTVRSGSLVITNQGNYFMSIGAGRIEVNGDDYFAVGIQSPIGQQLMGCRTGDKFELNGRPFSITNIY